MCVLRRRATPADDDGGTLRDSGRAEAQLLEGGSPRRRFAIASPVSSNRTIKIVIDPESSVDRVLWIGRMEDGAAGRDARGYCRRRSG
jgi:hypothetical protein